MSRNTWLILRHEIMTYLRKPSFFIITVGLPVLAALIFAGASFMQQRAGSTNNAAANGASEPSTAARIEGYVDLSGIVQELLPDIPQGALVPYADVDAAYQAYQRGEIAAYYIVAADYVESGELLYVNPDFSIVDSGSSDWMMRHTLIYNLLDRDMARFRRFWSVMDVQIVTPSPAETQSEDFAATFYVPYATAMIFYFVILMAASLLLNSLAEEKKNRVMEILIVSVTPRQMLTGKIIGLGIMGLLQTIIWIVTAYTLLRLSGRNLNMPAQFMLPPSILIWGVIFFLLGYAVYASLMAGLGALVPNLKEASQATFLVIWPMIIPLFFVSLMIEQPNGPVALALSLIPLTSPVTMMLRLAATQVPIWQPLLAVALLIGTAILIIRSVARLFQAQTLLSGQEVTPKRLYLALIKGE